ncbi:MAG: chorismate mutase [Candidatus Caenarcaniphilales bacterium]|nr:chorismate mutase [Candidatus Caenarcaniphilales bacterium]
MGLVAIRGATTVNVDSAEEIKSASVEMVKQIIEKNNIKPESDIVMLFLTMTSDLRSLNASSAIRTGMGWQHIPFFTSQEPEIDGMLSKCIRILVQCNLPVEQEEVKHIYLGEAANLRPDLQTKG